MAGAKARAVTTEQLQDGQHQQSICIVYPSAACHIAPSAFKSRRTSPMFSHTFAIDMP